MNRILMTFSDVRPTGAARTVCVAAVTLCAVLWLPVQRAAAEGSAPVSDDLSVEQARLADRYNRLEMVLGRLAELSGSTDPRRARLLREAIAKSREADVNRRFELIVSLLEEERLSAAATRQSELQSELDELLALLLKADRDRELESQHRRIKKYLQEVGRLIRLQKGLNARTEGGDDADRLAQDQGRVADQTGELGNDIGATEGGSPGQDAEAATPGESSGDGQDADRKTQQADPADGAPQDGKPQDGSNNGNAPKAADPSPSDGQPGESPSPPPADSESPGDALPSSNGQGGGGSGGQADPSPSPPDEEPTERAAKRLQAAQERMQQAQKQLEQAQREGATSKQREALQELEQAKAELERVLRQLREEEMERTLTLLAARFRKMLDAQLRVYDGTVRLDGVPSDERSHDHEIEAARLSREESLIVREADRALVLLREEGSSVAFPETVSLMRDDMQQVTSRLAELKVGSLTQSLEQDIIEALEEMIAALEQAIEDLEKKRTPPGQSPPAGEPSEPPLVDKLAELKMIRALQVRVNRRTQQYGQMIDGEQAETRELLEALARLAERQHRIYQATADLSQGRND